MENKKFEQLIELIINENEEQAKELFHDIVVEKSREIYENIMAEEAMEESMHDDMGEGSDHPAGQVMDMLDEISAEEENSMSEAEDDDIDAEIDDQDEEEGEDLTHDLEKAGDEEGEEGEAEDLEDRVVDIEDKLDMLMAKFEEEIMGLGKEGEEDVVASMMEASDEEEAVEEDVMEAVQLQKVSVTHGDDGAQKKSPVAANAGAKGMDSKPVKFSGAHEAVPTGPKGPSNEYSKKEGTLIGDVGNSPGKKKGPELKAAPKAETKDGSDNKKSPVAKG